MHVLAEIQYLLIVFLFAWNLNFLFTLHRRVNDSIINAMLKHINTNLQVCFDCKKSIQPIRETKSFITQSCNFFFKKKNKFEWEKVCIFTPLETEEKKNSAGMRLEAS